ncbi:hypothetical protein [Mycolicibacterium sp.]|uniref:hypothetical protein n=1 Tax=Mycolicibacterium sp. TaxID=2320850 RepID=UPI0037C9F028
MNLIGKASGGRVSAGGSRVPMRSRTIEINFPSPRKLCALLSFWFGLILLALSVLLIVFLSVGGPPTGPGTAAVLRIGLPSGFSGIRDQTTRKTAVKVEPHAVFGG